MIKINQKSDFKIKEKPTAVALEVPFIFSYYIFENKKYVASFDGSEYVNCKRNEDGSLDVIFNNPGFGIGHLKVERKYAINDKDFADGVYDVVTVDKTDVFITSGNTFETYVETLVVPPYLKGDKGDPMTWETMTEKERGELVEDIAEAIDPEMVMTENEKSRQEAERSRQTAEQQRSTTFNTLKGEMQSAITAGNAAAGNAQKVVDEYNTKVAEQDGKLSELGSEVTLSHFLLKRLEGKYWNHGGGFLVNGTDKSSTDMFAVMPNKTYKVDNILPSLHVCYYNSNKVRLSSKYIANTRVFTTPENCSFCTITVWDSVDWEYMSVLDVTETDKLTTDFTKFKFGFPRLEGKYWNHGIGILTEGTDKSSTDMFAVMPNTIYSVRNYSISTNLNVCFYNSEKSRISSKNITSNGIFTTPENCSFCTITIWENIAWDILFVEKVYELEEHPMNGKTFYSIGDSHRWRWLNKLEELTGGISGGDIFEAAINAYEKYYVSRTVAMAKYIVDLYKSGRQVDYIFLEYVHKYFVNNIEPANRYHYSGDITEAEPFLTQAYYDYKQRTFNNAIEAESFWNENFASIVGGFTPKSNAIIALKTGVKVQSPKFKLSGSVTTSGNFTIKFTDNSGELHQMSIAIPSGLSINEALTIVNEIEFSDSGSKWDNLSAHNTITDATIKFTYNGNLNDADASIKMGFDFGTTGVVYDGDWTINTETKDWIIGFKSHDVSKWGDKEKWSYLWANADAYIWIKASVELLQREVPTAKIFVWTLNTEAWNYNTNTIGGKSVLYPDGMLNVQAIYDSDEHKRMIQNLEGWKKVAEYYHLGFIPISEMNSISPANHKYYYPSDDVHPTQEGYDRVAEILAREVF